MMGAMDVIFCEGVPGAGKSTQAQWLETHLTRQGISARWYQEGERDHPLNWWEFSPEFDWLDYLRNASKTMNFSLEKWQTFTTDVAQNTPLTLLEAWPYLNCVSVFVMADVPERDLFVYWDSVREMLSPLRCKLVYFEQPDLRVALARILTIRGEGFQRELFYNMNRFPFCANRGLTDFEGVVTLWETHQRIIHEMCATFPGDTCFIDITRLNWSQARTKMLEFLGYPPDVTTPPDPQSFTGTYADDQGAVTVSLIDDTLVIADGEREVPLLRIDGPRYYYLGEPVVCTFMPAGTLRLDRSRYGDGVRNLLRV